MILAHCDAAVGQAMILAHCDAAVGQAMILAHCDAALGQISFVTLVLLLFKLLLLSYSVNEDVYCS